MIIYNSIGPSPRDASAFIIAVLYYNVKCMFTTDGLLYMPDLILRSAFTPQKEQLVEY